MEVWRYAGFPPRDETRVDDARRTEYRYGGESARGAGDVDAVAREHGGPGSGTDRELAPGSEYITNGMGGIAG
jgi:hypothetical protein